MTHEHFAAIEVARSAGARARAWFERGHELVVETKGAQDFVSQADRDVEEHVREELAKRFPDHAFYGEETGLSSSERRPTWIVDPIDGTTNFLRGIPFWCVSIGLAVEGRIEVAAVFDPMRGDMFEAVRGGGARLNGSPIRASAVDDPRRALVAAGHSRKSPAQTFHAIGERLLSEGFEMRRFGSAALASAYVAAGRVDAFFELMLSPWDVVGALLVCEEAGAATSRFLDGDGLTKGNPWLVANRALFPLLSTITTIR